MVVSLYNCCELTFSVLSSFIEEKIGRFRVNSLYFLPLYSANRPGQAEKDLEIYERIEISYNVLVSDQTFHIHLTL